MADQLAVRLDGGPLHGLWITDAEPSFEYDKSLSYTFAIEIRVEATFPGFENIRGFNRKPTVAMWALYEQLRITFGADEDPAIRIVRFNEVTWIPPTDAVVVTNIRDRPPWKVDAYDRLMEE